jgi:lysophospholipase L1-like esterase
LIHGALSLSFALSAAAAFWLAWTASKWALAAAVLTLLAGLARRLRRAPRWLLSLAMLNLLIVVPEIALRAVDFRYVSGIQLQNSRLFVAYQPDEELFWVLRGDDPAANSLGLPGGEVAVPKPDGTYRILFLGDSVMQQGYPGMVQAILNTGAGRRESVEAVTLALSGYSSHQGVVLAEKYGTAFQPDLVVVCYGWNDHWQAYQATDAEKVVNVPHGAFAEVVELLYDNLRLFQGVRWLGAQLSGGANPLDEVRVPPSDYEANLSRIAGIFSAGGIPIMFITAPTSHYALGVPDGIVEQHFAKSKESITDMHRAYNEIVRAVAQAHGAPLLDLEADWADSPSLRAIFSADGIHFTQNGLAALAQRVAAFIEANFPGDS